MNCKRLRHSIANCVSCLPSPNEAVLGEQKAQEIARMKRLWSSVGDICRWACAKTGTQCGPRSAGMMEGTGRRRAPLPQPLSSPVPRGREAVALAAGEGRGPAVGGERWGEGPEGY